MSGIKRFEEINAWKKARDLVKAVYEATSESAFSKDYALKDQIRRSAISTISNIAEGFERDGNKEFVNYLSVAKSSSGEVRTQLYIARDLGYLSNDKFDDLMNLSEETSRLISGFMKYLKSVNMVGRKFV
jgi:four helix bundle protein